jgi:hypothetical protein
MPTVPSGFPTVAPSTPQVPPTIVRAHEGICTAWDPGFGTVEMRSSAHQSSRPQCTGRQRFGTDAAQLGGSNGSTEHPGTDGPSDLDSADVTEGSTYTSSFVPSARRRHAGLRCASLGLACNAVCSTRAHARRLADAIQSVTFQTTSGINWTWSCAERPFEQEQVDRYTAYGCGGRGSCIENCDGPDDRLCEMVFSRAFNADPCEFAGDDRCDGPVPPGSNTRTTGLCFVGDYKDCGTPNDDVWEGVELKGPLPAIHSLGCFQDLRIMYACFGWACFAYYPARLSHMRSIAWLQQFATQFSHWGTACKFSRLHQQVTKALETVSHPLLRCIRTKRLPLSLLCRDLRDNRFIGKVPEGLQAFQDSRTALDVKYCVSESYVYTAVNRDTEFVRCY